MGAIFLIGILASVSVATAGEPYRIDTFGIGHADVVLVGDIQGILTSDGQLLTNAVNLQDQAQLTDIRSRCAVTNMLADGSKKIGCLFRLNVSAVFKGSVTGNTIDVFCSSIGGFHPGVSGFFFLQDVAFKGGDLLVRCDPGLWPIPKYCTEAPALKGVGKGVSGIRMFLNRMISNSNDEVSARAATACADIGGATSIPLIRKRFAEHLAKPGAKDDHIAVAYIEALLKLGDSYTLIAYADWLVAHSNAVRTYEHLGSHDLPYSQTPFEEEDRQIAAALSKLAATDLGVMKGAAQWALETVRESPSPEPADDDYVMVTPDDRAVGTEKKRRTDDLRAIYAAKKAWLQAHPGATTDTPTAKDLSPYFKGSAPVPPAGWSYEIGGPKEFPYAVPPLGYAIGQQPGPVEAQPEVTTEPPDETTNTALTAEEVCSRNLQLILAAKIQWELQFDKTNGAPADVREIDKYSGNYGHLVCPSGGRYMYNPAGADPECSFARTNSNGTVLRHRLAGSLGTP